MLGRRFAIAAIVGGLGLGTLASGCTGGTAAAPTSSTSAVPTKETPTPTPTAASTPTKTETPPKKIPSTFNARNFDNHLTDVNPWVPLTPGLQTVSKGYVTVGERRLPHIRVNTITDVTKRVNGVRALLVLDQDFDGGQLSEQAVDYLAEDEGGNVWYVGSYTEAYEGGVFLNAEDAWLAGVNGAAPGMYMPGDPKTRTRPFYQTRIPGGAQTTAEVVKVGQKTCVPFKCFTDVVIIEEESTENKFWAPGVGGILTEPLAGAAQEIEKLVNVRELSSKALAELSAEALKLDRNAAARVPTVFGASKPAERGR